MRYLTIILILFIMPGGIDAIAQSPDITQLEYFFDTDPGYGNGVAVSVTPDPVTSTTFDIDISGLEPGFHKVYFRTQDDNGDWSISNIKNVFVKDDAASNPLADIVDMEYYFDTDPGFGNGTAVPVTAGSITSTAFDIDISGLEPGFHKVYFRTQDDNGDWSINNIKNVFVKDDPASNPLADIVDMEYFFDTDPGYGNGTAVPIIAGSITSTAFDIDISGLEPGFHKVYFRTQDDNGDWSISNIKNVFVKDDPASNPLSDIIAMEYFIDTDPGFGNGTNVPLGPDNIINATIDLDVSGISTGTHDMYLRVMNANHNWSLINVSSFEVSEVELAAYLEGPYNGSDMNTTLNSGGNLPLSQPFNVAPWNYAGTESVASIPNVNVVDWVLLETRKADEAASATTATISSRYAAFLLNDGSIVDLDGFSSPTFNTYADTTNFVVIHHRNHLGILSAEDLDYSGSSYSYDFTTTAGQAHNSGQKDLGSGAYGLYTGDGNADGNIDADDISTVWASDAGSNGYLNGDFDMNGEANNSDKNDNWLPNNTIGSEVPD